MEAANDTIVSTVSEVISEHALEKYMPFQTASYFDGALKYLFDRTVISPRAVVPIDFIDFLPLC